MKHDHFTELQRCYEQLQTSVRSRDTVSRDNMYRDNESRDSRDVEGRKTLDSCPPPDLSSWDNEGCRFPFNFPSIIFL